MTVNRHMVQFLAAADPYTFLVCQTRGPSCTPRGPTSHGDCWGRALLRKRFETMRVSKNQSQRTGNPAPAFPARSQGQRGPLPPTLLPAPHQTLKLIAWGKLTFDENGRTHP